MAFSTLTELSEVVCFFNLMHGMLSSDFKYSFTGARNEFKFFMNTFQKRRTSYVIKLGDDDYRNTILD